MTEPEPIVIARDKIKRAWNEFEPKLIVGLLSGSTAGFLVSILANYGVHISQLQNDILVVGLFFIGGYLSPSSGLTITRPVYDAANRIIANVEQHPRDAVATVTASTPIQSPAPGVFTKVITPDPDVKSADEKPTEVLAPPLSPGAAFLAARSTGPANEAFTNNGGH